MNDNLHISPAGLALQKRYERGPAATSPNGFAPRMYVCPAGKPTIGWGHVITQFDAYLRNQVIDEATADRILTQDNLQREVELKRLVKVPLTQNEFDALLCLVLNIGVGKADGVAGDFADSTLLRKLNANDKRGAADEFPKWDKYRDPTCGCLKVSEGLHRRRLDERALFLGAANV
jgi:lysozyme